MPQSASNNQTQAGAHNGAPTAGVQQRLLARLDELEASGTLGVLADLAEALKAMVDSMTPGIVVRMASLAAEAGALADELVQNGQPVLPDALRALGAAARQARTQKKPPSLGQLARLATDADTRQGLAFMLLFARELGKRLPPANPKA
ncbi:MAG: DUF1641 domain-containing protein [Bacillota bacterium]